MGFRGVEWLERGRLAILARQAAMQRHDFDPNTDFHSVVIPPVRPSGRDFMPAQGSDPYAVPWIGPFTVDI